jgi:hypothetical protein
MRQYNAGFDKIAHSTEKYSNKGKLDKELDARQTKLHPRGNSPVNIYQLFSPFKKEEREKELRKGRRHLCYIGLKIRLGEAREPGNQEPEFITFPTSLPLLTSALSRV